MTALLRRVEAGDQEAKNALFELVYAELHRRADALMRKQPQGHTLQATALVGEVYFRMFKGSVGPWNDRKHFLLAASKAMRHVLVDHARRKAANKRAGKRVDSPLDSIVVEYEDRSLDLEQLQDALLRLEQTDPVMATGVEMYFFGGASMEETARALDIPKRTFERKMSLTKAWLYAEVL